MGCGVGRTIYGDLRSVMADGDDCRHASRHMGKTVLRQQAAFFIGDQELFREVGKDANPISALIDHAIQNAVHAVEINRSIGVKRRRRYGPDSTVNSHPRLLLNLEVI
jgi:hypothetical protein